MRSNFRSERRPVLAAFPALFCLHMLATTPKAMPIISERLAELARGRGFRGGSDPALSLPQPTALSIFERDRDPLVASYPESVGTLASHNRPSTEFPAQNIFLHLPPRPQTRRVPAPSRPTHRTVSPAATSRTSVTIMGGPIAEFLREAAAAGANLPHTNLAPDRV